VAATIFINAEYSIADAAAYHLVKPHVVNQVIFRLVREAYMPAISSASDELIAGGAFGSETRDRHLERPTSLEHFFRSEAVQRSH
jgi:hypothetical protein